MEIKQIVNLRHKAQSSYDLQRRSPVGEATDRWITRDLTESIIGQADDTQVLCVYVHCTRRDIRRRTTNDIQIREPVSRQWRQQLQSEISTQRPHGGLDSMSEMHVL